MAYQNTTGQVAKVMLCSWQYPVAFAWDCSYIAVCDSDVYHPRKRSDMQTYYSEHREKASDNLMLSVRQSPFGIKTLSRPLALLLCAKHAAKVRIKTETSK